MRRVALVVATCIAVPFFNALNNEHHFAKQIDHQEALDRQCARVEPGDLTRAIIECSKTVRPILPDK